MEKETTDYADFTDYEGFTTQIQFRSSACF